MENAKNLTIGVVMDPIESINPAKDTTLALMLAAQAMGASVFYMAQDGLYIKDGQARAVMRPVMVYDNKDKWFEAGAAEDKPLADLGLVLMRKDPPVDKRFIHACYVLAQAARDGVKVANNPLALIDFNEKILATHFPAFNPPYVIGADRDVLAAFMKQHENIIIKPLDSMGGDGVFLLRAGDVNFDVVWEVQTQRGTYPVIAQKFIPEISEGDKRIVIVGGKPFGHALVRRPKAGSIRGNLAAGGSAEIRPLTAREEEIATAVGAEIIRHGITFAGIDIIGDYLTEVNITSPTGIRQLAAATGEDLPGLILRSAIAG